VIVVQIPKRGQITWDGTDDVEVMVDLDVELALLDTGSRRGDRKLDEIRRSLESDAQRVLSQPAYSRDAFDGDGEFRLLPGAAAHARAALLSLHPDAEIVDDDEDDVEAALREADRM
jgi:hypothetical protein